MTALEDAMDCHIEQGVCCVGDCPQGSVSISDFSDEILLNILRYVPHQDLMLNVGRVCRKLKALSLDKSLTTRISLSKEYTVSDEAVKHLLRALANDVLSLDLSGCYWLSGSTVDLVARCRGVTRLDLSGCRVTSARLSRLLSSLQSVRSLAFDVTSGFDLQQLSGEAKAALGRLRELRQTVRVPSYGAVPCCGALRRLLLYLEAGDGWRDGGAGVQLLVGQSSVPRYQNLSWFSARLAPGEVNRTLLALYLAVFSTRAPQGLAGLVLSVPGPAPPPRPVAADSLLDSMGGGEAEVGALQLPRAWLDGAALGRVLAHGCPAYLNFSRSSTAGFNPLHVLLGSARDLRPLRSLNLRGCGRGLLPDCLGKGEEEMDAESVRALVESCPHLTHLNLSATHYHHHGDGAAGRDRHLCHSLGRLARLRSLSLPACALTPGLPPTNHQQNPSGALSPFTSGSLILGLKKSKRVGVPTYCPGANRAQEEDRDVSSSITPSPEDFCLWPLLKGCPHLMELELIGPGFSSAMPRNEPANRKDSAACPWSCRVGDPELAALGGLRFLRRLTLAHLPGVLKGTGLIDMAQGCKDLQALSLANLGSLKTMNYAPALQEALTHCRQLRELRLEQPYFNASAVFFEALGHCQALRRLCLISRHGTFQASAMATFMQCCGEVIVCHMFMGGTLVACKALQKSLLEAFSAARPALSVVVYPLLHEELGQVIREMPLCHLDEITLFKSRVAEEPTALW